jgi:cell division septum initiation protein DivIVA
MRSGLQGGSPAGYVPVKNLPQGMIDDLGLATQMNQLGVINTARTNALGAGVDAARVAPSIPASTGTAVTRARDAAATASARARDVASSTAGRARDAASSAAGRARDAASRTAGRARDAAGRAARSSVGRTVAGGAGAGAVLHTAGAFEDEGARARVAENRLNSSSAYLDGLVDLKALLG